MGLNIESNRKILIFVSDWVQMPNLEHQLNQNKSAKSPVFSYKFQFFKISRLEGDPLRLGKGPPEFRNRGSSQRLGKGAP